MVTSLMVVVSPFWIASGTPAEASAEAAPQAQRALASSSPTAPARLSGMLGAHPAGVKRQMTRL